MNQTESEGKTFAPHLLDKWKDGGIADGFITDPHSDVRIPEYGPLENAHKHLSASLIERSRFKAPDEAVLDWTS